tara:strand:+ start:165 stop:749 length:585 start_codon:yes stop_codon:yes gene_type:complete
MDKNKRNVMIIGVGGIGSYLAPLLKRVGTYSMFLADPDIVEEKNLLYQNFDKVNVGEKKVDSLFMHGHVRSEYRIRTDACLRKDKMDLIICCADNLDIRRLLYRQGFQDDAKVKWLDLRAQGRNGALISYLTDPKFSDMFLQGPEGSFSCQGEQDEITPESVHFTHVAVAGMAAQWIQRWFNGEEVKDKMVINI